MDPATPITDRVSGARTRYVLGCGFALFLAHSYLHFAFNWWNAKRLDGLQTTYLLLGPVLWSVAVFLPQRSSASSWRSPSWFAFASGVCSLILAGGISGWGASDFAGWNGVVSILIGLCAFAFGVVTALLGKWLLSLLRASERGAVNESRVALRAAASCLPASSVLQIASDWAARNWLAMPKYAWGDAEVNYSLQQRAFQDVDFYLMGVAWAAWLAVTIWSFVPPRARWDDAG